MLGHAPISEVAISSLPEAGGGGSTTVTVNDATHGHTADSPAITQTHEITVAESSHSHTADSPAITQTHEISVNEALHAHAADQPTITQTHVIAVSETLHSHTADNITVTLVGVVIPLGPVNTMLGDFINEQLHYRAVPITGLSFALLDSSNAPVTSGSATAYITKDGGTQAATTSAPTHEGNGQWSLDLSKEEMDAEMVGIIVTHASAVPVSFPIRTQ